MPVRVGLTVQKFQGMEAAFILALAKRFGLEYVEMTTGMFDEIKKISRLVRGIKVGFHLPIICEHGWDFSCVSENKKIDDLIFKINQHWKKLNLKYFLTHPPEPEETTAKIETSEEFLFANLKRLPGHIFIENVPTWGAERFLVFYEIAKHALGEQLSGICLDVPHHYVIGQDPIEQIKFWNRKIKCIHLSDCVHGHDLHLPFGCGGELPIDDVLQALADIGYNQYINLELLPKTFNDLPYVIYSYLKVLKKFRPAKYYCTKFRVLIVMPILRRLLFSK